MPISNQPKSAKNEPQFYKKATVYGLSTDPNVNGPVWTIKYTGKIGVQNGQIVEPSNRMFIQVPYSGFLNSPTFNETIPRSFYDRFDSDRSWVYLGIVILFESSKDLNAFKTAMRGRSRNTEISPLIPNEPRNETTGKKEDDCCCKDCCEDSCDICFEQHCEDCCAGCISSCIKSFFSNFGCIFKCCKSCCKCCCCNCCCLDLCDD